MNYLRKVLGVLGLLFAAAMPTGYAAFDPVGQDIDIFLANPNQASSRPNILMIMDNTANWSQTSPSGGSKFDIEKPALYSVVNGLTTGFNVGLMMFGETGSPNDSVDGGYVRFAVRRMSGTTTTGNKGAFLNLINSLGENSDKSNNAIYSLTMYEAYAYFAGVTARAGAGKAKRDTAGNTSTNAPYTYNLSGNAFTGSSSTTYVSPVTSGCQKNFIIFISNGPALDNSSSLSTAQSLLEPLVNQSPPSTITIPAPDSGSQNNWTDEYAKYMAQNGFACVNLASGTNAFATTYVVEIDPGTTGQGPNHTALMRSTAVWGKGKYFAVSSGGGGSAIVTTLQSIFTEIQAVNSVFASTTLPVSVNVRGTNLNQVYIGVFRPDPAKKPRWPGNLKLYNLALFSGRAGLSDANVTQAEDSATGFISGSAQSFWSQSSRTGGAGTGYFSFRSPYATTDIGQDDDVPDGDLVEKGGAGQRLRIAYASDQSTRNLYTCTGTCAAGSSLSSTLFADSNTAGVTAGDLGTYVKKSVTALTGAGTTATATVANHGFGAGPVTIEGALPDVYNVRNVTVTTVDANTFQYTLPSSVTGGNAFASAQGHGLVSGDKVDVTGCTGSYDVTGGTVSKVDANTFTYLPSGTPGSATSSCTVTGKKAASSIVIYGRSGAGTTTDLVTVTLPNHGFATNDSITMSGITCPSDPLDLLSINRCTGTNGTKTITVLDGNKFTYTISNISTSIQTSTAVAVVNAGHGYATGESNLSITGSSSSTYNKSNANITVIDSTAFTYPLGTNVTSDASPSPVISAVKQGLTFTSASLTHPTTGAAAGQNTATITTSANHGFAAGQQVTVSGATNPVFNGTFTISNVPAANQLSYVRMPIGSATTPGTGVIVATTASGACSIGCVAALVNPITHPTTGNAAAQNVATVTLVSNHGVATSTTFTVTISGADQVEYNGVWTATSSAANQFTFTHAGIAGAASSASGLTVVGPSTKTINTLGRYVVPVADATGTIYAAKRIFNPTTPTNPTLTSQSSAGGTITAGRESDPDSAARTLLINWVRGQDNNTVSGTPEDENGNGVYTDIRAYPHGDVLHSRPAVINYNRNSDDNDVVIYYGANDGIFHAVQGGYGSTGGNELWGFVPSEHFSKLGRLRSNTPTISPTNPKNYFFDGPIGIYTKDVDGNGKLSYASGDKVYLYLTMRRGGRYIYALDASNPADPKFLWKRGCPNADNNTGCDTGFEEIGQTWSEPKIGYLKAFTNPVLIFGAGYDNKAEDIHPCLMTGMDATGVTYIAGGSVSFETTTTGSCTSTGGAAFTQPRTMGRGIFFVDATNGTLLYRIGPDASASRQVAGMAYSIAADVTILNRDRDNTRALGSTRENVPTGYLDRVYAVDTGGNIWRVDVNDASTGNWVVTQLASIAGTGLADKRKMLFAPDVVYSNDDSGNYDAVLVGTGDREHPFDASVNDRFYMFKDRKTGLDATGQATITETDLLDVTSNCLQDCGAAARVSAAADLLAAKGWKLRFGTGEKDVGTATTLGGVTFFNTNTPSSQTTDSCGSNLGVAREYAVGFQDATATNVLNSTGTPTAAYRSVIHAGGGFLPSPVPVIVQIGSTKYQAVISGTSVGNPGGLTLENRIRTYWYRRID